MQACMPRKPSTCLRGKRATNHRIQMAHHCLGPAKISYCSTTGTHKDLYAFHNFQKIRVSFPNGRSRSRVYRVKGGFSGMTFGGWLLATKKRLPTARNGFGLLQHLHGRLRGDDMRDSKRRARVWHELAVVFLLFIFFPHIPYTLTYNVYGAGCPFMGDCTFSITNRSSRRS